MKRLVVASFLVWGSLLSAAPVGKLTHQQEAKDLATGFTYLRAEPQAALMSRERPQLGGMIQGPRDMDPQSTLMQEHQALTRLVTPGLKIEEILPLIWWGVAIAFFLPLLTMRRT